VKFSACDICIKPFGLVDGKPGAFRVLSREFGDMFVCSCQSAAAVYHHDGDIGFLQGAHRLVNHEFFDADLATGNTAGIDNEIWHRADFAKTVLPVTGQSRIVRDQRVARTRQAIE
jgi:hypothetical protein